MGEHVSGVKRKFGDATCLDVWDGVAQGREDAFESAHVHKVYEAIAPHFSSTRYKAWPKVAEFVNSQAESSFILDVGCGNGKSLAGVEGGRILMGCDMSEGLLTFAASQGIQCQVCNAVSLPHKPNSFDAVLSIAMLHHLSTPQRRGRALSEMIRVLRPGGCLLVYVWAAGQKRFLAAGTQDVTVPWTMHDKFKKAKVAKNTPKAEEEEGTKEQAEEKDEVHDRYYHLFVEGELEDLMKAAGPVTIEKSYYDCDNWCVIAKKCAEGEAATPTAVPTATV